MQTIRVGKGYTLATTVEIADDDGAIITNYFDGSEPLTLRVLNSAGAAVTWSNSLVSWNDFAAGLVDLVIHELDTGTVGRYQLSIQYVKSTYKFEALVCGVEVENRA